MFSIFLELVKRVGIFVIIGQTIMHFGIGKKYERYMKLVISFMVAAQIIFAFGVYLKRDEPAWEMMSAEEYLKEWDLSMRELEEQMKSSKESMTVKLEEKMKQTDGNIAEYGKGMSDNIRIERIIIP